MSLLVRLTEHLDELEVPWALSDAGEIAFDIPLPKRAEFFTWSVQALTLAEGEQHDPKDTAVVERIWEELERG